MEWIELKKMVFYAHHGVMEQEQIVGNTFHVDLKLCLDLSKAIESDSLEDTLNYAEIFHLIKKEMAVPSRLLEHAAGKIVRKMKQTYPVIQKIEIRLAKINPPISGEMEEAAVIISE